VRRSGEVRKNAREWKTGTDEERRDLLDTFHDCLMKEDKSRLKRKKFRKKKPKRELKRKEDSNISIPRPPKEPGRSPFLPLLSMRKSFGTPNSNQSDRLNLAFRPLRERL